MQFSAAQIALMINGRVEGNGSAMVGSFGKIEQAISGQLAFLANPKYEEYLYSTQASIIIINEQQELKHLVPATLIRVPDAYTAERIAQRSPGAPNGSGDQRKRVRQNDRGGKVPAAAFLCHSR